DVTEHRQAGAQLLGQPPDLGCDLVGIAGAQHQVGGDQTQRHMVAEQAPVGVECCLEREEALERIDGRRVLRLPAVETVAKRHQGSLPLHSPAETVTSSMFQLPRSNTPPLSML